MPNRRHQGFGILSCALSAVIFAACGGSGSGGTGGASGAAGGRGGQGGAAGAPGSGGQAGAGASAGQGGASGAVAGNGGNAGSNAGGSGGAAGAAGQAGSGQAGAGGIAGQAGSGASAGQGGGSAGAGGAGGNPPSTFSCSDLGAVDSDASSRMCFDFSSTSAASSWMPDGGTWTVVNGQYVGTGPSDAVTCVGAGSAMTASLVDNFSAADVRVHVQMTSVDRPDKVIVLRSRDSGNRVELNFLANFNYGTPEGGVLIIQELVNCAYFNRNPPGTIAIPHNIGDTITVDLELRGTQLTVSFDGSQVFSGAIAVATDPGGVGLGVITGGTVVFDDFWVEALN